MDFLRTIVEFHTLAVPVTVVVSMANIGWEIPGILSCDRWGGNWLTCLVWEWWFWMSGSIFRVPGGVGSDVRSAVCLGESNCDGRWLVGYKVLQIASGHVLSAESEHAILVTLL